MNNIALIIGGVVIWAIGTFVIGKWFHVFNICPKCPEHGKCSLPFVSSFFSWPIAFPLSLIRKTFGELFKAQKCVTAYKVAGDDPYRDNDHCSNCGAAFVDKPPETKKPEAKKKLPVIKSKQASAWGVLSR